MARQQRLMESLTEADQVVKPVPSQPEAPSQQQTDEEQAALTEALSFLVQGDMSAAREVLLPFGDAAVYAQTLITLARILSTEGFFDRALELLERAERLDPGDTRVWWHLAELFALRRQGTDEVRYRRKLAFVAPSPPAQAFIDLVRAVLRANRKTVSLAAGEVRLAMKKLAASGAATTETNIAMAEAVFAFDVLAKDARALYRSAQPSQTGEVDVTARWFRFWDWCNHVGATVTRLTDDGIPAHRPMIAELHDVIISPRLQWVPLVDDGRAILRGFAVQRIQLRSEDALTPLLMSGAKLAELRLPSNIPVIDRPALLLGGAPQYYHNTIEFLSALAVAEKTGIGIDLPLVVNDDLAPFQVEQLDLLGYPESRLIRVRANQPTRFRRLTVPSRLVQGGRWIDPMLARWYRERLGSPLSFNKLGTRRIYLSHEDTMHRRVVNEEEVTALLLRHGYATVASERLSVREQINLFAGASHIVAATGAALTNMVFAPSGARVVALYNRHLVQGGGDIYFGALATACGHRFLKLECAPERVLTGQRVIDADLIVDLEELSTALDSVG